MRIFCKKGDFDLPKDFSIEITKYHPLFNDEGEQSTPLTLPPTEHNLYMLGFPDRIDSYYKPVSEIQIGIADGIFIMKGKMVIHTANQEDGISCSLYFNDGDFYTKIDDTDLNEIELDVIEGIGSTRNEKVQYLINLLKTEYQTQASDMYSVFPVKTSRSITRKIQIPMGMGGYYDYEETFDLVLNGFETNIVWEDEYLNIFMGEREQTHIENGAEINVLKGYGMTVFVNLFYLLKKIFEYFGYTFDDNTVRNEVNAVGNKIVVLNNVADAIYDGKIDLSQLVPAMSVKDFLKQVAVYLAGTFVIDEINKKVGFLMFIVAYDDFYWDDLSGFVNSKPKIESIDFKNTDIWNTQETTLKKSANKSYIEVSLPKEVLYEYSNVIYGTTLMIFKIQLSLMDVGDVIHLNSSVHLDTPADNTSSSDNENKSDFILCGVRNNYREAIENRKISENEIIAVTWYYKGGSENIYGKTPDALTTLKSLYQPYLDWIKNSNIKLNCTMGLTLDRLFNFYMDPKYKIGNQLFFVNKITYKLPYEKEQSVELLVAGNYRDR
jgi:hypothetical protein